MSVVHVVAENLIPFWDELYRDFLRTSIPENQQMEDTSTRKRIRIACDNCRRKKIKCNGENPCSNCIPSKAQCFYKERKVSKRTLDDKSARRTHLSKSIDSLDSRLSKLELVISKLSNNIDIIAHGNHSHNNSNSGNSGRHHSRSPDSMVNYDSDGNEVNADDSTEEEEQPPSQRATDSNSYIVLATEGNGNQSLKSINSTFMPNQSVVCTFPNEQYFGLHTIMSIFSDQSLNWIENILGSEANVVLPVRNIPLIFATKLRTFTMKFMDPPIVDHKNRKRLEERPFPENKNLVLSLIQNLYGRITKINIIAPVKEITDLFEQYYQNFDPQFYNEKKRKFKISELLLMTSALLNAIMAKIDQDIILSHSEAGASCATAQKNAMTDAYSSPELLQELAYTDLLALKDTLFDNAIYYYLRICVISDGIDTIRAIIILITHIEGNFVLCHVNYMLSSVAIRFAQEMGLHRAESYSQLPEHEQMRRRCVWWLCHYYDVEICFRTGKPPLINTSDVTTNTDSDPKAFPFLSQGTPNSPFYPQGSNVTLQIAEEYFGANTDSVGYRKLSLLLSNYRSRSYSELFAAGVKLDSSEDLCSKIDAINSDMFRAAQLVHPNYIPRFYNDPEFIRIVRDWSGEFEMIVSTQLHYFLHLMLVNRIPSMVKNTTPETLQNLLKYRQICLDSARTVILIATQLNKDNCFASFFNYIAFYPLSAYLTLVSSILNHPILPDAHSDLNLLIETSMDFFCVGVSAKKGSNNIYTNNNSMTNLVVRLMLDVVIRFYELKTNTTEYKRDPKLQAHLNSCRVEFPELYTNATEFKSNMKRAILGDSPFSNQGETLKPRDDPRIQTTSPSQYPSVSNILHREPLGSNYDVATDCRPQNSLKSQEATSQIFPTVFDNDESEVMADLFNDDVLTQFNNLPNFFFENGFGV